MRRKLATLIGVLALLVLVALWSRDIVWRDPCRESLAALTLRLSMSDYEISGVESARIGAITSAHRRLHAYEYSFRSRDNASNPWHHARWLVIFADDGTPLGGYRVEDGYSLHTAGSTVILRPRSHPDRLAVMNFGTDIPSEGPPNITGRFNTRIGSAHILPHGEWE